MKMTIEIGLDNADFTTPQRGITRNGGTVARVLRELASRVDEAYITHDDEFSVNDINGRPALKAKVIGEHNDYQSRDNRFESFPFDEFRQELVDLLDEGDHMDLEPQLTHLLDNCVGRPQGTGDGCSASILLDPERKERQLQLYATDEDGINVPDNDQEDWAISFYMDGKPLRDTNGGRVTLFWYEVEGEGEGEDDD
ncbi:hypothetical protein [Endozoicomonas sp. ALC066]|uniref:hypothetical protein n=1 Tax=Endozoicomonas sp. ALC066 TaxID=3403078 RepID=UPI003BB5CF97